MLQIAVDAHLGAGDTEGNIGLALAEREDLRAALDWAEANDVTFGLRLAVELLNLWVASSPQEGVERIRRLLDRAGEISLELRARALRAYGAAAWIAGHDDLAERLGRESLELFEQLGDEQAIAMQQHMLAVNAWRREDWDDMRELTDQSLALARGRFTFLETTGYWLSGQLALHEGDVEGALELTRRSAEMAQKEGWEWWESGQRHELLMLALRRGDLDEAEREGRVALEMELAQENRLWALYTLAGLAQVALARGALERAGLLWGAAEKEAESLPRWPDERARRIGALAEEDREQVIDARERGRALDLWDAAELALERGG
jgi:hypothetical protein